MLTVETNPVKKLAMTGQFSSWIALVDNLT